MGRGIRKQLPEKADLYLVGGALRDQLLGEKEKDRDWAVGGISEGEASDLFKDSEELVVANKRIGWRLPSGEEVALLRREESTGPGHTDFKINTENVSIEEDLLRRDFTCNALALNTKTGELIDPLGGKDDIKNGILRATNDNIFREDPLRLLRATLLEARFNLQPDKKTESLMRSADTSHLSPERIWGEVRRIIQAPFAAEALRRLIKVEQYEKVFPELKESIGWNQNSKHHSLSCDEHCLLTLKNAGKISTDESLLLAAWLHDSGKPASAWMGKDGRLHYYKKEGQPSHEEVGATIAKKLLYRLRAPTKVQEQVSYLVQNHMWQEIQEGWQNKTPRKKNLIARKFISKHPDYWRELILLRRADTLSKGKDVEEDLANLADFKKRLERESLGEWRELKINGDDLLKEGLQGAQIGQVLEELQRRVCNQPDQNQKERLLIWARELAK